MRRWIIAAVLLGALALIATSALFVLGVFATNAGLASLEQPEEVPDEIRDLIVVRGTVSSIDGSVVGIKVEESDVVIDPELFLDRSHVSILSDLNIEDCFVFAYDPDVQDGALIEPIWVSTGGETQYAL